MSSFRTVVLVFAGFLTVLFALNFYFYDMGWIPYLFLISGLISYIVFGASNICSGVFIKTICKADTHEKLIALTFDDGPSKNTDVILDVLKAYNVKAGFFCVGKNIETHKDVVKRLVDEGHLIGNHSYSHHFWFDFFSAQKMIEELTKTETLIKDITGKEVKLFRPPYGVTNPPLSKAVKIMNYITVGWSLRSMDTVTKNNKKLLNNLKRKLKPGCIVLLHDVNGISKEVLTDFLDFIINNNYQIIELDRLLKIQAYD
ncbi:MAG: polysaccharide deacetylase family protein [Bacteroidales bacterium]|nr:polysaccharide deacetylase family protein [Bacteroidales bacterium]